ncbi:MAG TPA: DUF4350 domain-containing protein [Candidatus Acidoferrales bacterium]|nr:DUF4350 domain-containing protein [Candidatus Acidoferrales bacterium]
MSDNRSGERAALNWRGPLLAAAIFAGVFGILLLMAHLNQSKTSDEGSSFRQDPYGTSLLFDSYESAGYQVKRSQDENSLADQDAPRTTAFFIGGYNYRDVETRDGKIVTGGKFHGLLEEFLGRGGRVVLLRHEPGISVAPISKPEGEPKSGGRKWQKEKTWGLENGYDSPGKREPGPAWATALFPAMPAGSETMYLAVDAPWLKIDGQWTALYAGPMNAMDGSLVKPKADGESPARVYMAMRRVGDGELVAASQESFLLNEAIKTYPNPALLDFLAGGRSVIWVDETLHGLHQDEGVLWLVQRYRLQAALLLFWATLLALLWSMSGDLVRRPARNPSAEIVSQREGPGAAAQRLLQRSIATEQVVAECWDQFRRRSPQDAQAISADPRWGPRLRAALAQPPLAGYKELRQLIAERRASAKGLAHPDREARNNSLASPKTTPEEARIA